MSALHQDLIQEGIQRVLKSLWPPSLLIFSNNMIPQSFLNVKFLAETDRVFQCPVGKINPFASLHPGPYPLKFI